MDSTPTPETVDGLNNTTTPDEGDGSSGGSSRYEAFFRLLESRLRQDSWLAELYGRTLGLETAASWLAVVLVPVCLAAGLAGNLGTLGLMLRARRKWSKPHVYIACLLPANATVAAHQFVSQTLHRALFSLTDGSYEFPLYPSDSFCIAWTFVMSSASGYALLLMLALMLDRLHALTWPFNYRSFGLQFSRRVAAGLAVLSLALASPILPLYGLSRRLVFLDSDALLLNCFVPPNSPLQRDAMTLYVFAVHRGGLLSVAMLGFNAYLAIRVRQIQRGSGAAVGETAAARREERGSAKVTLLIFSLSLFYTATLTPAAAVLGISIVYAISDDTRDSDPVGYYLNVSYLTNLGLLFNVLYAVFYGFNWMVYAKDVPFVRKPMLHACRRWCRSCCCCRNRYTDRAATSRSYNNSYEIRTRPGGPSSGDGERQVAIAAEFTGSAETTLDR